MWRGANTTGLEFKLHDIVFREYLPNDLDACAKLAEQSWPYRRGRLSQPYEHNWMIGFVQSARLWSHWAEVACDPYGVVGVLFGRVDTEWNRTKSFWMILKELPLLVGSLNKMPRNPTTAVVLTWKFLMTETKLALRRPRTDAEIAFLTVDLKHRGRGIGKALVERFFGAASRSSARVVTVYTDDKTSNWRFYEQMGFERVATFHDNLASYYDNTHANGVVYLFRLDRGNKASQKP
jgi:ribosomal protein S18 acetylase RimI-like enzyme